MPILIAFLIAGFILFLIGAFKIKKPIEYRLDEMELTNYENQQQ